MKSKNVFIASDHAGFLLKQNLINQPTDQSITLIDLGPVSEDRCDYPDYADLVCQKVMDNPGSFGLLICGSGQGMAMRANKYPQIRAALCWNAETAKLSRQHNDANVLCLGSRVVEKREIQEIIFSFFQTEFEGGRHQARVDKISKKINS